MAEQTATVQKKRRKWPWILGGVIVLFIIIGVAGNDDDGSSQSSKHEEQQIYSLNQEVNSSDVIWKVTAVRDRGNKLLASESRYRSIATTKTTAGKFIEVSFVLENRSKDLASIASPNVVDSQSREFTPSSGASEWIPAGKELFILDNLQPNLPKDYVVIYEIPADAAGLKLKVGVLRPEIIDLGI